MESRRSCAGWLLALSFFSLFVHRSFSACLITALLRGEPKSKFGRDKFMLTEQG